MSPQPIIGITLDYINNEQYGYAQLPWYALRKNYIDVIFQCGGTCLLLPYNMQATDHFVNIIDGLIIPGSDNDINPKFYKQSVSSPFVNYQQDDCKVQFEMTMLSKLMKANKPFLGICHGMQLLNVYLGGTLIQHLSNNTINHKNTAHTITHKAKIIENTVAYNIYQSPSIEINSNHHQAVDQLGKGLKASVIAEDGIIEAVEHNLLPHIMGVQWHPEFLSNKNDILLLQHFIKICSNNKNYTI